MAESLETLRYNALFRQMPASNETFIYGTPPVLISCGKTALHCKFGYLDLV